MRRLVVVGLERRYGRKAARNYCHVAPWRSCTSVIGGFCLRCLYRGITGATRRSKRELTERHRRDSEVFAACFADHKAHHVQDGDMHGRLTPWRCDKCGQHWSKWQRAEEGGAASCVG